MFVSPEQRPSLDAEVSRYRLHQNDGADPGYLSYLARLTRPIIANVSVGARGLDYGCGPTPAMARLLTESGRPTVSYDPVFAPDESLLECHYDFVACSEVAEHAHHPRALFDTLAHLVAPGGTIGIMTQWYDGHDFGTWSYRRDFTHVSFFSRSTMQWIAEHYRWRLSTPETDVVILTTG